MHNQPAPFSRRSRLAILLLGVFLALPLLGHSPVQSADEPKSSDKFEIKPGDHICIIGNTLADRMQHDGWLETYFYSRFPKHDLVFRNLGFAGDELTLRLRSQSFGTPDQWLYGSAPVPEPNRLTTHNGVRANRFETTNTRADVVFALFGYNESFAGQAGLAQFKKDLDAFIKHTLAQSYNGKTAPRLVLFSPIAHEDLKDPNLSDGKENNRRLEIYTNAMAEVAKEAGVPFVDLFHTTRDLYPKAPGPLTINGVHLNARGNEAVAKIIDQTLFPRGDPPARDATAMEKLREAVIDKNYVWFSRYRVMDGYNVYGGRAFEKYADQQSNYEDQQRELEILDTMTDNRERRAWAVAQGKDMKIDDGNAPPLIPVRTNLTPDRIKNSPLLDGEDAIAKMKVAPGYKVTLFASEKEFPVLAKPVQMAFDPKGRLWVASWPSYPHWKPTEEMNDKILIFEDSKGKGKADKVTVFADHLNCPTGFEFYNNGILVAQAPDILYLRDSKGGDKADVRVRVLEGMDSADSHHTSNSFILDPGGAMYWQEGTFHHTQVETPYGPAVRCVNAGVYRYEPRSQKFETYITYGFANPHGHVFDHWGQDIVVDGTGANPYQAALFSGFLPYPLKHAHPPEVYNTKGIRPCPGMEICTSKHFPADMQGNLLVCNVIGFQGIRRVKLGDSGAGIVGTDLEPLLSSTDPNFRPSDIKVGPDGAIYFTDWYNPIIGHLQHAIRDPNRDRTHGRIYKITYEKNELEKPVKIAGEPIDKLLELLKEPEDRVRYRVKIELGGRDSFRVIAGLNKWLTELDKKDPNYEHNRLEALWLHQYHNIVDVELLKQVLSSPNFHARAAATRVLCYWRDRVPDALELLKERAADEEPRVRLEAIRAASFFTAPEAIEVVLISEERPTDPYLDFLRGETHKALDPIVSKAIKAGQEIKFTTTAGARYFLKNVATDDLLKMKRTRGVYLELLFRPGVRDEFRKESLTALAKEDAKSEVRVLLDAIRTHDGQGGNQDESVAFDLVRLLTDRDPKELAESRADLERMATTAKTPLSRELGFVALIAADGNPDKAWQLAKREVATLQDLVNAMPLIRDFGQRSSLYPNVALLLDGLPGSLAATVPNAKTTTGRYVRVELPGRNKTLTLAEVEVYSGGRNIAREGKASQSTTAHGGDASRGIDGNKSGKYNDGGQTHTEENSTNPWWEVDLGAEFPIETVVIYNRTDDGLGKRLDGFTLKILDKSHQTATFESKKNPAPETKATFAVGSSSPERVIRRAAMNALTSVRGKEAETFKALARFVKDDAERPAAVQALLRIPAATWPKDEAGPLLETLLAAIKKVPTADRTLPVVLDNMQLADNLASLLPLSEAKTIRKELGELGVRVIRLATVVEQMRYDKERFAVKAGKPFEVILENADLMPHNFVITQPGAMEEIGNLAETQATQAGALERHYVPTSSKVLFSSRLIQPRETQKLSLTAPATPGIYPYVCTYPGHWRRMYGAMYVVADLDEYLADPEGYLVKNPLPIKDDLLKFVRPRTEWKFEDLTVSVEEMKSGRSYTNGKQLFQLAACVSCHKFNGAGTDFGPDLTKLDPKQQKPIEILHDIIDPSFRINEKYYQYTFELKSGKQVTGLILEETKDVVKVIENPLVKAEPRVLKVLEIDTRKKSMVSIMPKGLLDKLTREEILDLVAYVMSKGDANHPLFKGEHEHHQH